MKIKQSHLLSSVHYRLLFRLRGKSVAYSQGLAAAAQDAVAALLCLLQTADSKALCCALLLIFSFNNSFRVSTKAFLFHFSHLHSPICLLRKEGRGDEAEAEAAHTHANLTRRFDRHDVDEYRFLSTGQQQQWQDDD